MSLAIDANLLLYASDRQSPFHERARPALERLVSGSDIIYLFWPVIMAYVRIRDASVDLRAPDVA